MKKKGLFVLVAVCLFMSAAESFAFTLNPFKGAGRARAETLMVTGNYVDSRLLVELAQWRTKQPILLFSPEVDGTSQLYFLTAGGKVTNMEVEKFQEILEFINPKRVIFLGGNDYVPNGFVEMAKAQYPVVIIDSADWQRNSVVLGEWLKQDTLPKLFKEYTDKLVQGGIKTAN